MGVVSYGWGCADDELSGVYARVTHFLDWINAEIAVTKYKYKSTSYIDRINANLLLKCKEKELIVNVTL